MKHKHHIIPKHMEGNDDPSNIIELTIEEHAEEHHKLYEQFGKREDYIAWKAMSGMIGKEEIIRELSILGAKSRKNTKHSLETKKLLSEKHKGMKHSEATKLKMSITRKGKPNGLLGKKVSDETKRKISQALLGNKNAVGGKK